MSDDWTKEEYVSDCCGLAKTGDAEYCPGCYEWAEFVQLNHYMLNRLEPAQYSYAPSQEQLRKWIGRICFNRL